MPRHRRTGVLAAKAVVVTAVVVTAVVISLTGTRALAAGSTRVTKPSQTIVALQSDDAIALFRLPAIPSPTDPSSSGPAPNRRSLTNAMPPGSSRTVLVRSATSTTVAGISVRLPPTPATVPFTTRRPSAHVSPLFSDLCIGGFAAFLLIAGIQFALTRPGRRGRWTL